MMESFIGKPLKWMTPGIQVMNIVALITIHLVLYSTIGNIVIASRIQTILCALLGILNMYVIKFRGKPVLLSDIKSIKTAASVASGYDFSLDLKGIVLITACIAILSVEKFIKLDKQKLSKRLITLAVSVIALILQINMMHTPQVKADLGISEKQYDPLYMIQVNGILLNYFVQSGYETVTEPEDYAKDEISTLYNNLEDDNVTSDKLPNIIVIMNEAFSDIKVLGDIETNIDYMPFMHSLQNGYDNAVTGYLNVSVMGGNTANTEFEFLTGHTMRFFGDGQIPYQECINNKIDALPNYLKELGYDTVAMHPYYPDGWNRTNVYNYMGFDKFLSLDDYTREYDIGIHTSDLDCVNKIISYYENYRIHSENPLFVFNVTMQNHSPYTSDRYDFEPDVLVKDYEGEDLNNYLSLVKLSDKSLETLVEYFKTVDEETLIVFFGDHQPNYPFMAGVPDIDSLIINNLKPGVVSSLTLEQAVNMHRVPFAVWANYDIEEQSDLEISTNFLAAKTFEIAGIPKNKYQNYLLDVYNSYSVITQKRLLNTKGNEFGAVGLPEDLKEYNQLQYYILFDK